MKKVVIDKNKCIGCFKCKRTCYEVFDIDVDGKAMVRYGAEGNTEEAEPAVINCPVGAIKIVDEYGRNSKSTSLFDVFLNMLSDEDE